MFIGLYGNGSKIRAVKRACEDESCSNELVFRPYQLMATVKETGQERAMV